MLKYNLNVKVFLTKLLLKQIKKEITGNKIISISQKNVCWCTYFFVNVNLIQLACLQIHVVIFKYL